MLTRLASLFGKAAVGRLAVVTLILLTAKNLEAHDFWIEPSPFHASPGATVAVGLRVGQNFVGDAVPRLSRSIEKFVVRQGGSEQPIVGSENTDPAGWFRADGRATAIIAYRSVSSFIEMPADKFEDYLRLEGLERIIENRAKRGEHGKPGRERFYRYAKALLAGDQPSGGVSQPLGLVYEIVPDADPTAGMTAFRGRILHDRKPLGDALVVAMLHSDPSVRLTTRSDARGAFTLVLPQAGIWLLKSVHMVRASFFSDADWESLWASLTFELPGARP